MTKPTHGDTADDDNDDMIQRLFRVMGWIVVVLGICVPLAGVGRLIRGLTVSWWEPIALVGVGGSVALIGLALALPNLGRRFAVVALSTWGGLLIACAVVSLLIPTEVLVTRGRGPRTVVSAQVRGVLMLGVGGALMGMAIAKALSLRRNRTTTPDDAR